MTTGQPHLPTPVGLGAFALSHWELLALLKMLRVASIPGLHDDSMAQLGAQLAPETLEDRTRVAIEDLAARGVAVVVPESNTPYKPTLLVSTPVLAMLGVCASSRYSIRIATTMKGERIECYLHEWMLLGVVHAIQRSSALHLFLPAAGRKGILYSVEELTDAQSVNRPAPEAASLGTVSVQRLRNALLATPVGSSGAVAQAIGASSLSPNHQRALAETLAHADRFDEIAVGVRKSNTAIQQATALHVVRGGDEYLCATGYDQSEFLVYAGGRGAVARWIEQLLP